jgi:hypothetical protein
MAFCGPAMTAFNRERERFMKLHSQQTIPSPDLACVITQAYVKVANL